MLPNFANTLFRRSKVCVCSMEGIHDAFIIELKRIAWSDTGCAHTSVEFIINLQDSKNTLMQTATGPT